MNVYPNANPAPRKNGNKKLIRAGVIAAVAIVLALIVYGGCTAIVPTGYTGIPDHLRQGGRLHAGRGLPPEKPLPGGHCDG